MEQNAKYAVIIHGKGGSPFKSWLPWLKQKLEEKEYVCLVPIFPAQSDSKLSDWFTVLNSLPVDITHTIFVAHARGAMALLRWINLLPPEKRIRQIITIACNYDYQEKRQDSDEFYSKKLDYADLKNKCRSFVIIHSENDPYVPIDAGKKLAANLGARFSSYTYAGHFGSGKLEAPEILKEIIEE